MRLDSFPFKRCAAFSGSQMEVMTMKRGCMPKVFSPAALVIPRDHVNTMNSNSTLCGDVNPHVTSQRKQTRRAVGSSLQEILDLHSCHMGSLT